MDLGARALMAHERGHIELRHTRANALLAGRSALDSVLRGRELAADCVAARRLGSGDRAAVLDAATFFARLGPVQFDSAHPPGSVRATKVLACLPPENPTTDSVPGTAAVDGEGVG